MIQMPNFNISVDTIEQDLDDLLNQNRQDIQALLKCSSHSFDTLMVELERLSERLHHFWSPISHLHAVDDHAALRAVYDRCLPKLSAYHSELGQSSALYEAVLSLKNDASYPSLSQPKQRVIAHMVRDFELSGVHLSDADKKVLADCFQQLALASNRFSQNVLDATQHTYFDIEDLRDLEGLPETVCQVAKQRAQAAGVIGFRLTIDGATWQDVMTYAQNRALRRTLYEAYVTRASDRGPLGDQYNNQANMEEILSLRAKVAQLLGFEHYAEYSLATKMLKKPEEVMSFLQELSQASKPQAKREFEKLKQFADKHLALTELEAWDVAFVSEKYRQSLYDFSDEMLRPYFPLDQVLQGLFETVEQLFDVSIQCMDEVETWHQDVKAYAITDQDGEILAAFYTDLLARPTKRSGAWMDDCQSRRRMPDGTLQRPIAFINTNFAQALDNQPTLLGHNDVITLFHEFGHGLQHMLTTIDLPDVAGINGVPWDAVEVASQWLENFAWERPCLDLFARHYQTKDPLPEPLFSAMKQAQNFQSALRMVRQLEFALFDFNLHMSSESPVGDEIFNILSQVRERVAVIPAPDFNRFQHSFAHIFAGGYAAGYYSYQWADVMAQDVFSEFLKHGLFEKQVAQRFRDTFLSQGGAEDVLTLFLAFCQRSPSVDALLKRSEIGIK